MWGQTAFTPDQPDYGLLNRTNTRGVREATCLTPSAGCLLWSQQYNLPDE